MQIVTSPGLCSACFGAKPDVRHIDFEIVYDGQPVLTEEGTVAISPVTGYQLWHEKLVICEQCLREAAQLLTIKPDVHQRQNREISRLMKENSSLRKILVTERRQHTELLEVKA